MREARNDARLNWIGIRNEDDGMVPLAFRAA
jgi:hypothetical protein